MAQQQGSLQNLPRPETLFGAVKGGVQTFAGALVTLLNNWYLTLQQATAVVITGITESALGFTRASLGIVNSSTPRLLLEDSGTIWEIDNDGNNLRIFQPNVVKAQFTKTGYFQVASLAVFGALAAQVSGVEPLEVQGTGAGISIVDRSGAPPTQPRWVLYASAGTLRIWNSVNNDVITIDQAGHITAAGVLLGGGGVSVVATTHIVNQTIAVGGTLYSVPAASAGLYRVTMEITYNNTDAINHTIGCSLSSAWDGGTDSYGVTNVTVTSGSRGYARGVFAVYSDASSNINYNITGTFGGGAAYDMAASVEKLFIG